jgi:hypothetical protein
MTGKSIIIYYLTEDLKNQKEINEISFLKNHFKLVLVTDTPGIQNRIGVHSISIKSQSTIFKKLIIKWSRLCFLFAKIGESRMDAQFSVRNVYTKSKLMRIAVNAIWRIKGLAVINRVLPTYDELYFFPFKSYFLVKGWVDGGEAKRKKRKHRIMVHDALLVRINQFSGLIAKARLDGVKTLANVKSWDNPFYSQLAIGASGFLVWSQSMWIDINRTHRLSGKFYYVWGARPFYEFLVTRLERLKENSCEIRARAMLPTRSTRQITVGYAAAFADKLMAGYEIDMVSRLAIELAEKLPAARLRLRPYPTLGDDFYAELENFDNVEVVSIEGSTIDRFGDGREYIRFGSISERLNYLDGCDVFLSVATSFTIEAAVCDLPVVHFKLSLDRRNTRGEREIFKRVDISDHLTKYFEGILMLAENYEEMVEHIKKALLAPKLYQEKSSDLLKILGVQTAENPISDAPQPFAGDIIEWIES